MANTHTDGFSTVINFRQRRIQYERAIFEHETDRPHDVLPGLTTRIGGFSRITVVERFKIGISKHPDRRCREAYKYAYDEMIVLYCFYAGPLQI